MPMEDLVALLFLLSLAKNVLPDVIWHMKKRLTQCLAYFSRDASICTQFASQTPFFLLWRDANMDLGCWAKFLPHPGLVWHSLSCHVELAPELLWLWGKCCSQRLYKCMSMCTCSSTEQNIFCYYILQMHQPHSDIPHSSLAPVLSRFKSLHTHLYKAPCFLHKTKINE